jgi:ribosomal protein S18 acetylase RimI-like enzyme
VGFVSTLPTREALGVLNLLQVAPEVQGAGVGRVLAEAALHALAQQGFAQVQVHVDAANVVACALYTHVGFVTTRIDVVHERGP